MKIVFTLIFVLIYSVAEGRIPIAAISGGIPDAATTTTTIAATDYTADANCVGAWFMNNNGGNETDRSSNCGGEAGSCGNDLTQTSGTIPTSSDVPSGYGGTSRDFEAGDTEYLQYIDGSELDINGNQDMSIVAWIKLESSPTQADIVAKYYAAAAPDNDRQYQLAYRGSSEDCLAGYISTNGTDYSKAYAPTTTQIDDGSWHHVAMVFDYDAGGSHIILYINGEEATNSTNNPKDHTGGIGNLDAYFAIGAGLSATGAPAPTVYFDGLIDEVAVFNKALSLTDIEAIKTNGISGNKGGSD